MTVPLARTDPDPGFNILQSLQTAFTDGRAEPAGANRD